MFAVRTLTEITLRALLIAVLLFNAVAINPIPVQAESISIIARRFGDASTFKPPTFERPIERVTELVSALNLPSDQPKRERSQLYLVDPEEGLRLAQDWIGAGPMMADWTVQKTSSVGNSEVLATFYSGSLNKPPSVSILRNFVGQIHYTVKPTEAGPNAWVSFQLTGIATEAGSATSAGFDRARFYVDIKSPSGLPVSCSEQTAGNNSSTCVQDSISHIHGLADGGSLHYLRFSPFNDAGSWARVAVKGLTAWQELIVTFGSASYIN